MTKTLLFGGSGFFGPVILSKDKNIISVGRTKPPSYCQNKHIQINNLDELYKLDELEFDNERWVSRTIHIKGIKYLEISKLYFCELCLNWCRTKTNIRLPIKVFNSLIKR